MTDELDPSASPQDDGSTAPAPPTATTSSTTTSNATTSNGGSSLVNGRYEIRSKLRDTALGADYLANDTQLDRLVVFKALSSTLTGDRGFIERFRAQAQSAANLTHPGLAAVYDWSRDPAGIPDLPGPLYYLIAERVAGRTLGELVGANGAMPVDRILHVLVGVTSALGYAHRADVLHGGLNPDAIIVSPTGVVKVTDLGLNLALAPSWQPDDSTNEHAAEIALWRAPEQFRGEPADARTDVYQLSLIAYFMATGRPPFTGDNVAQIAQRHREVIPPAPTKINTTIPKQLEGIIGRSLAKKSEERYQSINDQRAALVRFRESRSATPGSPGIGDGALSLRPLGPGSAALTDDATSMIGAAVSNDSPGEMRTTRIDSRVAAGGILPDDATQVRSPGAIAVDDDTDLGEPTGNFAALDQPRRKSGPMVALIAVLLAILGVLLYFLSQQLGLFGPAKASIAVPNVIGKSAAEAQSTISAAGLTPDTENLPDAKTPADTVFAQFPEPPAKIPVGAKVTIRVSTGAANPIVPNVVGATADEARAKLAQRGFNMEIIEKEDAAVQPGTVIAQEPQAELEEGAPPGATVRVTVAILSGTVDMPDVAGKTAEDAKLELTKAQFRTTVQTESSQTVPKGQVIRTEPAAGTKVERGAPVVIFRSGGNGVIIPQLRGMIEAEALAKVAIEAPGVKIDQTTRPVVDPTEVGTVVAQSPAAGTEVDPGSTLSIRIGRLDDTPTTTKKGGAEVSAPPTTAGPTSATGAGVISTAVVTAAPVPSPTAAPATNASPTTVQAEVRIPTTSEAPAATPAPVPAGGAAVTAVP